MKKVLYLILSLCTVIALAGCGQSKESAPTPAKPADQSNASGKTVTIGLIPAEAKISPEAREKLAKIVSDGLGVKAEVKDYPDYNGVVEALNYGKLDIAFLGPYTYVLAHNKSGAEAFVAKTAKGVPYYYSYIIAPKDSPLNSIDDLVKDSKNIRFAFGDPNSTSGSLIPGIKLKDLGVFTDKDNNKFKSITYTGAHDVTAKAVAGKQVDAGAIDSAYFEKMIDQKLINKDDYKIIWQSDKLFQYPFAVRKDFPQDLKTKLPDLFVNIKDKDVLDAFAADGFVKASDQDFSAIKDAAEKAGKLK